jgi:hypothetical protein
MKEENANPHFDHSSTVPTIARDYWMLAAAAQTGHAISLMRNYAAAGTPLLRDERGGLLIAQQSLAEKLDHLAR